MATNVLELRGPDHNHRPIDPLDEVTIQTMADVGNAATTLERQSRSHGLRVMLWHDLASMDEMVDAEGQLLNRDILGWDDEQLEPFRDIQRAVHSPVLRACRVENEPFLINHRVIRTRWANHYLSTIGLDDPEPMLSVHSAIVVPVHLTFGQIGVAIFTSVEPTLTDLSRQFGQISDHLAALARRFMSGYVKISRDPRYLPTENVLTVRQIECLRWAAMGKTDYEIGIILGCSHAGVRYHISRAGLRLGATNRTQSVFHACQLGYLSRSY
jgi:DNA-binding CsgD family transcriptional regulator